MKDDLQTLFDIGSSSSFQELRDKATARLSAMQKSHAAESERARTGCSGLGCTNRDRYHGIHLCHK